MIYHAATSVAIVRIKELVSHGWDVLVSSQLLAPACMPFLALLFQPFGLMSFLLFQPAFGSCMHAFFWHMCFFQPLGLMPCLFLATLCLMHAIHFLAHVWLFLARWAHVIFFWPAFGSCIQSICWHMVFFQPIGLMLFLFSSHLLAHACMPFSQHMLFFPAHWAHVISFIQPASGSGMHAFFLHFFSALWAHVISFFVASFGHMHGCHCLAHSFVSPLGTCFLLCSPFGLMFACCLHACLVFQPTLLAHFCFASPSWLMLLCHFQVLFFCNSFSFIHS